MLLWEVLSAPEGPVRDHGPGETTIALRAQRLPFDKRCTAITKSGRRCRGRIRPGADCCTFHDPRLTAERRRRIAAQGGRRHHPLSHLPDGYLRKLTSRRAAGEAMDRLYRELRLGIITPEMGRVLFNVLTRILDSGLADGGSIPPAVQRTKASRMRPKLGDWLTHTEQAQWRQAVANAPPAGSQGHREVRAG